MNQKAPEGCLYVCMACGKTADWKYGFDDQNKFAASRGWDVSCTLNSVLYKKEDLRFSPNGGVFEIKDGAVPQDN